MNRYNSQGLIDKKYNFYTILINELEKRRKDLEEVKGGECRDKNLIISEGKGLKPRS